VLLATKRLAQCATLAAVASSKSGSLVDGDGSFQVGDSTGGVLVAHDFAWPRTG
jgi:hypothetical protein